MKRAVIWLALVAVFDGLAFVGLRALFVPSQIEAGPPPPRATPCVYTASAADGYCAQQQMYEYARRIDEADQRAQLDLTPVTDSCAAFDNSRTGEVTSIDQLRDLPQQICGRN